MTKLLFSSIRGSSPFVPPLSNHSIGGMKGDNPLIDDNVKLPAITYHGSNGSRHLNILPHFTPNLPIWGFPRHFTTELKDVLFGYFSFTAFEPRESNCS